MRPKVLVVDDQAVNIEILYRALSDGYQILMATSGSAALKTCREQLPDLVLLDIGMPDIDGHEVCRRLKADPATQDIPIIFVTAHDDPAQEATGFELGAVDFITKPVNAAVVRARVGTHLGFAHWRSLLAATLEATADGILVADLGGGIIALNERFAQMWELPPVLFRSSPHGEPGEIFRRMTQQLRDPAQAPASWTASDEGGDASGLRTIDLNGERTFEWQTRPLQINANRAGSVISFRDVTEQTRATRRLAMANETLEQRVLERTADLEWALHQAGEANRAKSDFLSNMSHEIRTPMNGVIGITHLALKADPSAEQRVYLEKIQGAGQHLLGIINDILDFSKIDAGKLELDDQVVTLSELLDTVMNQTRHTALAKGLSLSVTLDDAVPRRVRADALRVRQVLLNFIVNAIKFTERGGVRVRVGVAAGRAGGRVLRFEVDDDGIGMTEAQTGKAFQSFEQGDTSTTRKYGGTGLGLAISKRLAELMGGEIGVSSRLGIGTTFWFTLPLRDAWLDDGQPASGSVRPAADTAMRRLDGARILLAEDNALNAEVACSLLDAVGATVRVAENGQKALDLLAAEAFDIVLMDMQMPLMDGLEATRRARAHPAWANLPIIAMTANTRPADRAACLDAGMNDFTIKPVEPALLYETLAAWLPDRGVGTAAAGPERQLTVEAPPAEPAKTGAPEVLDLSILARIVGGRQDRVKRYAMQFAESVPETLAELHAALDSGELSALARLGHRLKSSARTVGALRVAETCDALEALDDGQGVAAARPLVGNLTVELAAVVRTVAHAYGSAPVPDGTST